jgi:ABC-type sugar transport system substrate-binding protein
MNKKAPTMRDVARLAEVSIATVSAVANGTSRVSPKRAERVRKAMEALDYHADQIARSLKTGRTRVVGIILPDVTNPLYPEVIVGAEEIARVAGYSVILCNANEDREQEQQQLNILFSHRVDGVLIACSDPSISFDRLMRRRFPIVCFDRIPPGFQGDSAATDNFSGGYEATQHLISAGPQTNCRACRAGGIVNALAAPGRFSSRDERGAVAGAGGVLHHGRHVARDRLRSWAAIAEPGYAANGRVLYQQQAVPGPGASGEPGWDALSGRDKPGGL